MGIEESIRTLNSTRVFKMGQEPLWDVNLVHKTEDNETWLLFRSNHALCDGLAFISFLENMASPKFQKDWDKNLTQDRLRDSLLRCCSLVKAPLDIAIFLGAAVRTGMRQGQERLPTGQLCYKTTEIDVQRIKEVSLGCEVSFNSVALALYASALRKLAEMRMENPGPTMVHIPIPWPGRGEKLRNWGSMASVVLPLDEVCPLKRLQNIDRQLMFIKGSSLPVLCFTLNKISGLSLAAPQKKMLSTIARNNSTVAFIPFQLSREKVNLFDVEMTGVKSICVPMDGTRSLVCVSVGYGDKSYFSLNADTGILSQEEADVLMQSWDKELVLLNKMKNLQTQTV